MGLPLKNSVAPQLGGGEGVRILYAIAHLERSLTLKTLVFYKAAFGVVNPPPPPPPPPHGCLLREGTLREGTKSGWVRVGNNQDPAEYKLAFIPSIYLAFFFVA